MSAGSGVGLPDALQSGAARLLHVIVLATDELVGRRAAHVLERDGLTASHTDNPSNLVETTLKPDVIVVLADDSAPGYERWLPRRRPLPDAPVVVVSSRPGRAPIDEALAAGASGFVPDDALDERLAPTVRAVSAHQLAIPDERRDVIAHPILSPREKQVMSMVVLGFTNLEVANKLHVTETTVKSHLSSAYRKLRVRSRHEATALILSNRDLGLGILTLSDARGPRLSKMGG